MSYYRFYRLNNAGHIIGASDEECRDDGDAVYRAGLMAANEGAIEIWQRDRRINLVELDDRKRA